MANIDHVKYAFNSARKAFIPFIEFGYPTIEDSIESIKIMANAGACMIEVGIPCENPHLDGDVIYNASKMAIKNGATMNKCIEAIKTLRNQNFNTPILLMGYHASIKKENLNELARTCANTGINGFLIPDIPSQEQNYYQHVCQFYNLNLINFISPNTTEKEICDIAKRANGFIYAISRCGKTGARSYLPKSLASMINTIKKYTHLPVAAGFGVNSAIQANYYSQCSDGVIVGSAIVNKLSCSKKEAFNFAQNLVAHMM